MVKPIRPVAADDTSKRKDRREQFAKFSKENGKLPPLPVNPPAGLSDKAQAAYAELVPKLNESGFAKSLDIYLVMSFVGQWAIYTEAMQNVNDHGIVIETSRGATKNPAVNVANDALQKTLSIARQIGLTPSSRAELYDTSDDNPDDDGGAMAKMFNF